MKLHSRVRIVISLVKGLLISFSNGGLSLEHLFEINNTDKLLYYVGSNNQKDKLNFEVQSRYDLEYAVRNKGDPPLMSAAGKMVLIVNDEHQ